jgi:protein TonB
VAEAVLTAFEERERWFRRAVAISVAGHVLLLLLAFFSPFPRSHSTVALPGVVNVSLVAAPPGPPAAARPAPKPPAPAPPKAEVKPPEPQPAPKPPEVKADKKLLPKDPNREPKPKPKPAVAPKPAPTKPLGYDQAIDSLREELGEEASDAPDPELMASVRPGARSGPPGEGPGVAVDPEVAAWMRRVKIQVTKAWVVAPGLRRQVIQAQVRVTLDATGNVLGVQVTDSSGNPWYDESVVRAIEKATPLPPPPESGDWPFVFSPQDVL